MYLAWQSHPSISSPTSSTLSDLVLEQKRHVLSELQNTLYYVKVFLISAFSISVRLSLKGAEIMPTFLGGQAGAPPSNVESLSG